MGGCSTPYLTLEIGSKAENLFLFCKSAGVVPPCGDKEEFAIGLYPCGVQFVFKGPVADLTELVVSPAEE
jgi:hypothetical protein